MSVFCKNLKRLRLVKKLTQEQAAAALGVSAQSISRWECGNSLPDVTLLPAIAALYCVTIDDLYRENSAVYANYAQRLGCVYEATHDPEDFFRADTEYRKLLYSGEYTQDDLRMYGILHQYMMQNSMSKASELFDRALEMGFQEDPSVYWSVQRQKISLLSQIGKHKESIAEFLPQVTAGSRDVQVWICLIHAYQMAEDHEAAWECAKKAEKLFPENAMLHIYCGDLCRAMHRYDDAFVHWRRALELEPQWMDAAYSMGFCYEELGNYEKACEVWDAIAGELARRGYEPEVLWTRELAKKCRSRLKDPTV